MINSGIRVFIFDGDADYICNYMGVEAVVRISDTFDIRLSVSKFSTSLECALLG